MKLAYAQLPAHSRLQVSEEPDGTLIITLARPSAWKIAGQILLWLFTLPVVVVVIALLVVMVSSGPERTINALMMYWRDLPSKLARPFVGLVKLSLLAMGPFALAVLIFDPRQMQIRLDNDKLEVQSRIWFHRSKWEMPRSQVLHICVGKAAHTVVVHGPFPLFEVLDVRRRADAQWLCQQLRTELNLPEEGLAGWKA